jgi:hypothetical protein
MFSLKSLLIAVLVAAVFVAAFLNRSEVWAGVAVSVALVLLGCGLFSIYMFPERRAFFVPAVMIGVLYGSAGLIRPLGLNTSLVTTRLMFEWWYWRDDEAVTEAARNQGDLDVVVIDSRPKDMDKDTAYTVITSDVFYGSDERLAEWPNLQRIGHSAIALILAVIAGLVGSYVARKRAGAHGAG